MGEGVLIRCEYFTTKESYQGLVKGICTGNRINT